jgi:hypothetical protein
LPSRVVKPFGNRLDSGFNGHAVGRSCNDGFSCSKQEYGYLGRVEAIHQSGKLLRLVFGLFQAQSNRYRIQVELFTEISIGNEILDFDLGHLLDRNPEITQSGHELFESFPHITTSAGSGDGYLSRTKDHHRCCGVLRSIQQAGKALRIVICASEVHRHCHQIEFPSEISRADYILHLNGLGWVNDDCPITHIRGIDERANNLPDSPAKTLNGAKILRSLSSEKQ